MRRFYYAIKRQVRPLLCPFGRHDYKMGLTDKTGRPFACLWCRKSLTKQANTDKTFKPMTDILRNLVPMDWDDQQFCKYCGKVVVLIKSSLGFNDVVHTHSGEIYCDYPKGEKL